MWRFTWICSVYLYLCLYLHLYLYLYLYLYVYLSFIYLPVCLSACLAVYLSIYPSGTPISLSFLSLSVSRCLHIRDICLSILPLCLAGILSVDVMKNARHVCKKSASHTCNTWFVWFRTEEVPGPPGLSFLWQATSSESQANTTKESNTNSREERSSALQKRLCFTFFGFQAPGNLPDISESTSPDILEVWVVGGDVGCHGWPVGLKADRYGRTVGKGLAWWGGSRNCFGEWMRQWIGSWIPAVRARGYGAQHPSLPFQSLHSFEIRMLFLLALAVPVPVLAPALLVPATVFCICAFCDRSHFQH